MDTSNKVVDEQQDEIRRCISPYTDTHKNSEVTKTI